MPEPNREGPDRGETPLAAYVIGAAVVWAVLLPVVDWVRGDLDGIGRSALEGAAIGAFWGLCMRPLERLLRRRS